MKFELNQDLIQDAKAIQGTHPVMLVGAVVTSEAAAHGATEIEFTGSFDPDDDVVKMVIMSLLTIGFKISFAPESGIMETMKGLVPEWFEKKEDVEALKRIFDR
jgi:hypothetical protein